MAYPHLVTPYAIISFPHLFTPRPKAEGGKPVYSAAFLFDEKAQKTPQFKAMKDVVEAIIKEKFPKVARSQLYIPFRDGEEKADQYDGYAGTVFFNASSDRKPPIIDARKQPVLLPEEVWAGQLVRASINPFPFDRAGNKGVSWGLNSVQIVKADMPRIDGALSPEKTFDDLPEEYAGADDNDSPF